MNWFLIVPVILVVLGLPTVWLISEFKTNNRLIRCLLGISSIFCSFALAWLLTQMIRFNYNAWYGTASKSLIDATVTKLEAGETGKVISELKKLQIRFEPTYENKANFDELSKEFSERILNQ